MDFGVVLLNRQWPVAVAMCPPRCHGSTTEGPGTTRMPPEICINCKCQHICHHATLSALRVSINLNTHNVHQVHAGSRSTTPRRTPYCTIQGSSRSHDSQTPEASLPVRAARTPSDPTLRQPCPLVCFQATPAVAPGLQDIARRGSLGGAQQFARSTSSTGHCFLMLAFGHQCTHPPSRPRTRWTRLTGPGVVDSQRVTPWPRSKDLA